mgnify:CR=1 FL=1
MNDSRPPGFPSLAIGFFTPPSYPRTMFALRRSYQLTVLCLLFFQSPQPASAGHDLFALLVVAEKSPTGLDRLNVPVTLGVPIPAAAEITSITNLVLVGAERTQFAVINRWPNRGIRWLQIDALVNLPANESSVGLQLTTGQADAPLAPLANELPSSITISNGVIDFTIPKGTHDLIASMSTPDHSPLLPQPISLKFMDPLEQGEPSVRIVENGACKTVVERAQSFSEDGHAYQLRIRILNFRHQNDLSMELCLYSDPANQTPGSISPIEITFPFSSDQISPGEKEGHYQYYSINRSTSEPGTSLLLATERQSHAFDITSRHDSSVLSLQLHPREPLPPGGFLRTHFHLNTQPSADSKRQYESPLIGRAASLETYNDASVLYDKLIPYPEKAPPPAPDAMTANLGPLDRAAEQFRSLVRAVDEQYVNDATPTIDDLERYWRTAPNPLDSPSDALVAAPLALGDRSLFSAFRHWVSKVPDPIPTAIPLEKTPTALRYLVDKFRATSSPGEPNPVWPFIQERFLDLDWEQASQLTATLVQADEALLALRHALDHCMFSDPQENQILDSLSTLLASTPDEVRGDRWYCESYRLSGDPRFLQEGQIKLDGTVTEPGSNLRHLIQAPLRYRLWRHLALETIDKGEGRIHLSWTVPPRAERIRIKSGATPFRLPGTSPGGTLEFFKGADLPNLPSPGLVGSTQVIEIQQESTGQTQFMARYRERGPGLPNPKEEAQPSSALDSEETADGGTPSWRLLQIAGLALILVLLLMFWNRKSPSKQAIWGVLLCTLLGCAPGPSVETEDTRTEPSPRREASTQSGAYQVQYQPIPDPIPLNQHFALEVSIAGHEGGNSGLRIEVDADMPAHGHGINTTPTIQDNEDGTFRVEGILFHMKGDWELYVDVLNGPVRDRAAFPIRL